VRAADTLADSLGYAILPALEQPAFDAIIQELPSQVAARLALQPDELRTTIDHRLQDWL
jgi:hypothetical protein